MTLVEMWKGLNVTADLNTNVVLSMALTCVTQIMIENIDVTLQEIQGLSNFSFKLLIIYFKTKNFP